MKYPLHERKHLVRTAWRLFIYLLVRNISLPVQTLTRFRLLFVAFMIQNTVWDICNTMQRNVVVVILHFVRYPLPHYKIASRVAQSKFLRKLVTRNYLFTRLDLGQWFLVSLLISRKSRYRFRPNRFISQICLCTHRKSTDKNTSMIISFLLPRSTTCRLY